MGVVGFLGYKKILNLGICFILKKKYIFVGESVKNKWYGYVENSHAFIYESKMLT